MSERLVPHDLNPKFHSAASAFSQQRAGAMWAAAASIVRNPDAYELRVRVRKLEQAGRSLGILKRYKHSGELQSCLRQSKRE